MSSSWKKFMSINPYNDNIRCTYVMWGECRWLCTCSINFSKHYILSCSLNVLMYLKRPLIVRLVCVCCFDVFIGPLYAFSCDVYARAREPWYALLHKNGQSKDVNFSFLCWTYFIYTCLSTCLNLHVGVVSRPRNLWPRSEINEESFQKRGSLFRPKVMN